jgi:hypothetical protein
MDAERDQSLECDAWSDRMELQRARAEKRLAAHRPLRFAPAQTAVTPGAALSIALVVSPLTRCRVPPVVKEPRAARPQGGHTMNADDLKKLTTDSLDRLAELFDAAQSAQLTAFLKAMARFHRYGFHNVCLIASQRPTATRVAGFHAWRSLKRFVRKAERGIAILAPIVRRDVDNAEDDAKHVARRGVRVRRSADRRGAVARAQRIVR